LIIILAVFLILVLYDLQMFIREKAQIRVYIIYGFLMTVSLVVSLLIVAGKRPASPAQWIEALFKTAGVIK